jgi:phosphopantothenoylcysteine decarboxylase/phosphopantothenate--cysteine ligase
VESIRTVRELIRHGAEVQCMMSEDAEDMVHPESLRFASGKEVIRKIRGMVEHVSFFGKQGTADILVICPASANTISKIACGIADTPITLCACAALGAKRPMLVVPVMNAVLAENPAVSENIGKLRSYGVDIFIPEAAEGKLKIPEPEDIALHVMRALSGRPLAKKRVLVVSGSTEERIDDVRVVSNISTGQTGIEVAKEAYVQGAEVVMWIGRAHPSPPNYIPTKRFSDVASLDEMCKRLKVDIAVVSAAISDYTPSKKDGKIPSSKDKLTIELEPTPKIIRKIKKTGAFTVGFKAESKVAAETLVERAIDRMREHNLDMMVANDVSSMTGSETTAHVISKDGSASVFKGGKRDLAVFLVRKIIENIGKK